MKQKLFLVTINSFMLRIQVMMVQTIYNFNQFLRKMQNYYTKTKKKSSSKFSNAPVSIHSKKYIFQSGVLTPATILEIMIAKEVHFIFIFVMVKRESLKMEAGHMRNALSHQKKEMSST